MNEQSVKPGLAALSVLGGMASRSYPSADRCGSFTLSAR